VLLEGLVDAGAIEPPTSGDEHALQGLYWMAGYLAERQKRISFEGFSWDDPRFRALDAKVTVEVAYVPFAGGDLRGTLLDAVPRLRGGTALVGLDARASGLREFELAHQLFGQVTLFSWPHKPPEPADRRIHEARERGWTRVLKEHNLLPGRGIVVLDEHQGLVLTEPALARVAGFLVVLPGGATHLWWNPFCPTLDPEMEHYLAWMRGEGGPSEWREVLRYEGDEGED
jgi:hypothetical protein